MSAEEALIACGVDYSKPENREVVERVVLEEVYQRMRIGEFDCFADEFAARFPEYADGLRELLSQCQDQQSILALLSGNMALSDGRRPRPEPSPAGTPVISDYVLLHKIGNGSFGDVWLARNRLDAALCAIKVFDKQWTDEVRGVRAYRNCAPNHPHLVPIRHIGETEAVYYYVMELADNALEARSPVECYEPLSVQRLIQERGALAASEVAAILEQVLSGLKELHRNSISHCDIKPANILRINGRWQLGDIGLAADSRRGAEGRGTPAFWPPEKGTDSQVNDRYAIGMTAFVAATGQKPSSFKAQAAERMLPSRDRRSKRLEQFILKACNPEASNRFATVDQMARVVKSIARTWRQRIRAALPVVVAALGVVAIAYWLVDRHGQTRLIRQAEERELEEVGSKVRQHMQMNQWEEALAAGERRERLYRKLHPENEGELRMQHCWTEMARYLVHLQPASEREHAQFEMSGTVSLEVDRLDALGELDRAAILQAAHVKTRERILGANAPVLVELDRVYLASLNIGIAKRQRELGNDAEANRLLDEAARDCRRSAAVFDRELTPTQDHSMIAWHNLGKCLMAQGGQKTLEEAEGIQRRILRLRLETLKDHPYTVSSYLALAQNLASQRASHNSERERLDEASRHLDAARDMMQRPEGFPWKPGGDADRRSRHEELDAARRLVRRAREKLAGNE